MFISKSPLPYLLGLILFLGLGSSLRGQQASGYAPDRVIVSLEDLPAPVRLRARAKSCHGFLSRYDQAQVELWKFVPGNENDTTCLSTVADYILHLRSKYPGIHVQPDYRYFASVAPNDSLYSEQWNLQNRGQNGAVPGKGLNMEGAWESNREASDVVVGILDTGIDWDHPDLAENIWQNLGEDADGDGHTLEWDAGQSKWVLDPGDLTDNLDQDGNGYVNDLIGWNFVSDSLAGNGLSYAGFDPNDDNSHGTHVAGIMGARGNNGIGVSGVCWEVQLMPLKFMDANGTGYTSEAIEALNYALQKNVRISNNSWGGAPFDSALYQAIQLAQASKHLFVVAAGNGNLSNNDLNPAYPSSYDLPNVLSVGAHDSRAKVSFFSNIGPQSVDIFAPGGNQLNAIFSTMPNGGYGYKNGTSMAAPHAAGVAALLMAKFSNDSASFLKRKIVENAIPEDDLLGKCVAQGRLDATSALAKESEKENGENGIDVFGNFTRVNGLVTLGHKLYFAGTDFGVGEIDLRDSSLKNYSSYNSDLPTSKVERITRDSSGNIWVGSRNTNGIFRFDGQVWTHYENTLTHPITTIQDIEVDSSGRVWAGGYVSGGVKTLHSYKDGVWQSHDFEENISAFSIGDSGIIWIGTLGDGILKFNSLNDSIESNFTTSNSNIGSNIVYDILYSSQSLVWAGTSGSFGLSVIQNGVLTRHSFRFNTVQKVVEDKNGKLWTSNEKKAGEVYELSGITSSPKVYRIDNNVSNYQNERINSLHVDEQNKIWAGGTKKIYEVDTLFTELKEFPINRPNIPTASNYIAKDNENNLWLAGQDELAKFENDSWEIFQYSELPITQNTTNGGPITVLPNGNLWFLKAYLYESPGASPLDTVKRYNMPFSISSGDIENIDTTELWISSASRLGNYHILSNTFIDYDSLPTSSGSKIKLGSIKSIESQGDSILWLGDNNHGIIKFNLKTGIIDTLFSSLINNNHWDLIAGVDGSLWVAQQGNSTGIPRIKNDTLTIFTPQDYGISDEDFFSNTVDHDGNIWFGSSSGALLRYIPNLGVWNSWTSLTTSLPFLGGTTSNGDDPQITKIISLREGEIFFVSRDNGMFRFYPDATVSFGISKSIACLGDTLTFINTTERAQGFVWTIERDTVSTDTNLTYTFNQPGNFEVALHALDSVLGDRIYAQFIEVRAPIDVDLGADSLVCGKAIFLQPQLEGESFFWTDTLGNVLSNKKSISITQDGTYVLSVVDACGVQDADTLQVNFFADDCIWPGDINGDGRVNLTDFQLLALAHGDTGPLRADTSTNFAALTVPTDWSDSTLGINHKYFDLDGNGEVNIYAESGIIKKNFNFGHGGITAGNSEVVMRMRPRNRTYEFNDTIFLDFFVEADGGPVNDLYSAIWSVDLNILPSSTPFLDTTGSKLSQPGDQLAHIGVLEPEDKRVSFGLSRDGIAAIPVKGLLVGGGITITIDDIIEDPWTFASRRFLTIDLKEIVLRDEAGNPIPVSPISYNQTETIILEVPWKELDLNLFLEGATGSGSSMENTLRSRDFLPLAPPFPGYDEESVALDSLPEGAIDWIELEFRTDSSLASSHKKVALLLEDGTVWDPFAQDSTLQLLIPDGDYFIVVRHRNHLPVISSQKVNLSATPNQYSFSDQAGRALGYQHLVLLPNGKWGLRTGDADQNGRVLPSDKVYHWEKEIGKEGYLTADFNLDGIVDQADLDAWRNNFLLETNN